MPTTRSQTREREQREMSNSNQSNSASNSGDPSEVAPNLSVGIQTEVSSNNPQASQETQTANSNSEQASRDTQTNGEVRPQVNSTSVQANVPAEQNKEKSGDGGDDGVTLENYETASESEVEPKIQQPNPNHKPLKTLTISH